MIFGFENDETLWLNVTNLALGVVTLAAVAVVIIAVAREWVTHRKHARANDTLDDEMRALFHTASPHSLSVPDLGLTMADGGMPLTKSPEKNGAPEPGPRK